MAYPSQWTRQSAWVRPEPDGPHERMFARLWSMTFAFRTSSAAPAKPRQKSRTALDVWGSARLAINIQQSSLFIGNSSS